MSSASIVLLSFLFIFLSSSMGVTCRVFGAAFLFGVSQLCTDEMQVWLTTAGAALGKRDSAEHTNPGAAKTSELLGIWINPVGSPRIGLKQGQYVARSCVTVTHNNTRSLGRSRTPKAAQAVQSMFAHSRSCVSQSTLCSWHPTQARGTGQSHLI